MSLTPRAIYKDLKKKNLNKNTAVSLLISLIENVDTLNIRIESIKVLEKISLEFGLKDNYLFKLLENLFISDSNEEIRTTAANLIRDLYIERAILPMKWALINETSLNCLINIISTLKEINNIESDSILLDEINKIYDKKYRYNLKEAFNQKKIEEYSKDEIADLLINYHIISSLKHKFGYVNYETENGILTNLDLSNVDNQGLNKLYDSLKAISSITSLKKLDLRFNHLSNLPEDFCSSSSLEYLDLSYNKLKILPNSIGSLMSLKFLNLKSNRLITLPERIGELTSLKVLNLRVNRLIRLPNSFGILKSLKKLDLHGNQLYEIPLTLKSLSSLEQLELGWNKLIKVPDCIRYLSNLEKLGLGGNKLGQLPDWIGTLKTLRELYLYDNNLKMLPDAIGELKALEDLNLRNNQLEILPDSCEALTTLKRLNLSWNKLKFLPKWVGSLKSLEILSLWGNNLEDLPSSLEIINSLKILDLNFNENIKISDSLKDLEKKGLKIYK
jgi:Leucine-rich repeat (LRR) protein